MLWNKTQRAKLMGRELRCKFVFRNSPNECLLSNSNSFLLSILLFGVYSVYASQAKETLKIAATFAPHLRQLEEHIRESKMPKIEKQRFLDNIVHITHDLNHISKAKSTQEQDRLSEAVHDRMILLQSMVK
jgi:hypothetical protein